MQIFFVTNECNNQIIYFTTLTMLSPYRVELAGLSLQVMLTIARAKCHSIAACRVRSVTSRISIIAGSGIESGAVQWSVIN